MVLVGSNGPCWSLLVVVKEQVGSYVIMIMQHWSILVVMVLAGPTHLIMYTKDDEYRWAGVEDPKIMITTSRDPSSKLKQFAKELRLIFPGAQRLNRGTYEFKQLMEACR